MNLRRQKLSTNGLQDKIQLVPIDLQNRPAWYKVKLYLENKVPSLEHNGKVLRESLDLIKYVDANFEGTPILKDIDECKEKKACQCPDHIICSCMLANAI